jgi:hypothetical protein
MRFLTKESVLESLYWVFSIFAEELYIGEKEQEIFLRRKWTKPLLLKNNCNVSPLDTKTTAIINLVKILRYVVRIVPRILLTEHCFFLHWGIICFFFIIWASVKLKWYTNDELGKKA